MRIVAILCARNEIAYLKVVMPYLEQEGIEAILIDNGSSDGTVEWATSGAAPAILHVEHLPFTGVFDLSAQLAAKQAVVARVSHDWVVHQDADEILQAPTGWGGLRAHIERADAAGYNTINFQELVMLPFDPFVDDILANNRLCYYFDPRPLRLMRAWKRSARLGNVESGGHVLGGADVLVYPEPMILKHFMVRSQAHAYQKYLARSFASADLARGWHGNRLNFTSDNLKLPRPSPALQVLTSARETPSPLPPSTKRHFWEWGL